MSAETGQVKQRTPRVSRRAFQVLAVLLIGVLGIAIAAQVRDTGSGNSLDSARPADLLAVLDNLNRREAALRQEIDSLQSTVDSLQQRGSSAALDEAKQRLAALQVQVGTAAAVGPGTRMTLDDPGGKVGPEVVLDTIQELRAAGAEAIQIGGRDGAPLRVVVNTWVGGRAGAVVVDGTTLSPPYTVVAIGDPPTLAAAVNIPGGVVDTVSRSGGRLTIEQADSVTVSATRDPAAHQYAQPGK